MRDLVEVFEYARSRALWRVVAKTYELSQLLVDMLGVTGVGASYQHRVTCCRTSRTPMPITAIGRVLAPCM